MLIVVQLKLAWLGENVDYVF